MTEYICSNCHAPLLVMTQLPKDGVVPILLCRHCEDGAFMAGYIAGRRDVEKEVITFIQRGKDK